MMRRLLFWLLALLALLVVALVANTLRQGSRQIEVAPIPKLAVDAAGAAARLGEAVRARTVASRTDARHNQDQFAQLQAMLVARYPKLHATLTREMVGGLAMLYIWKGSDPTAKPILLMAHQDVVPIAPGTERQWKVDPWSGAVQDGFVWGRGAWDDKGNLIAQMEAVEMLVASGYQPQRTIYLSYGADEEVSGERGAAQVAALLASRGVHLDFVLDEGLLVTEHIMPGLEPPAALIGVAEKGFLSVLLRIAATPGHSSMPPPQGTGGIARMASALERIDHDQAPARIRGIAGQMFASVAPEMNFLPRLALSNLWLFGPVVQGQLERGPSTNALLRTTTALTMLSAGNADNVLPGQVDATINYRLLPGDTIADALQRLRTQVTQAIGDTQFELLPLAGASEASPVSPTDSRPYRLVERTVREVLPGTIVAPGLMLGATDSRYFTRISDNVFRFSPVRATATDLERFHGTNERIGIDNLAELIRFYHRLLSEGAKAS